MVDRMDGAGRPPVAPRRRGFNPSWSSIRKKISNEELQAKYATCLARADNHLEEGDRFRAAENFSTAARICMELAGRFKEAESEIHWLERSKQPRTLAIENYQFVGEDLNEARDISFLGKAYSRLGILKQNKRSLMRSVVERSLALELFIKMNRKNMMAEELSYLADDFRALGKLSQEAEERHHFFRMAHGCSQAAIRLYPQYLREGELANRLMHEEQFSVLALANATFALFDLEHVADIRAARDKNLEIAVKLKKMGLLSTAINSLGIAAKLQRKMAKELLTNPEEINLAIELMLQFRIWTAETGAEEERLEYSDKKIQELGELLRSLTVPVSA
ncbi:hypothetical protein HZC35_06880 [Candidatus Saganbacteria bacterium]|nr:hypothetical protein [Candidatus Saganbacteria bacterium]